MAPLIQHVRPCGCARVEQVVIQGVVLKVLALLQRAEVARVNLSIRGLLNSPELYTSIYVQALRVDAQKVEVTFQEYLLLLQMS